MRSKGEKPIAGQAEAPERDAADCPATNIQPLVIQTSRSPKPPGKPGPGHIETVIRIQTLLQKQSEADAQRRTAARSTQQILKLLQ